MHANIRNNQIIDFNSKYLDEDIIRVNTTEEMYKLYQQDSRAVVYHDGKIIKNVNYKDEFAQKERERVNMLSLTKREVFLALYKDKGITPEQIRAQITTPEALIEFDYANDYYRGNPLINLIGQALGYSTEQLDYLFVNKSLPDVDNSEIIEAKNTDGKTVSDSELVNNKTE